LAAVVTGVAAIGLVTLHAWRHEERLPAGIRAEPTAPILAPTLPTPSLASALPEQVPAQASKPAAPIARASRPRPSAATAPAEGAQPPETGKGSSAKACAELARQGASQPALDCYLQLANGDGLSAELALFEAARIEGKALRRPGRAVQVLDRYRQRFPDGSLRGEVMLAQIGWLLASGDDERARALVDEALASGLLHERTAELEQLRDKLGHVSQ
jgi:hypothetical protein